MRSRWVWPTERVNSGPGVERPGRRSRRYRNGVADRPSGVDSQTREAVNLRAVLAAAAITGRRHAWRVLAVALVVSLATAATEIVVDNAIDPDNDVLSTWGFLSAQAVSLFGTVLLAGFLCRLVGTPERRRDEVTIRRVLRTLPWSTLILADVVASVFTIVGFVLLVIPGLVVFNLLTVVGPVIEIEHRSAVAGLRRSAQLVRPYFWLVAGVLGVPGLVLATVESSLPDPHGPRAILEVLTVRGIVVALLETVIGLVAVALCYRLIDLAARRSSTVDS